MINNVDKTYPGDLIILCAGTVLYYLEMGEMRKTLKEDELFLCVGRLHSPGGLIEGLSWTALTLISPSENCLLHTYY